MPLGVLPDIGRQFEGRMSSGPHLARTATEKMGSPVLAGNVNCILFPPIEHWMRMYLHAGNRSGWLSQPGICLRGTDPSILGRAARSLLSQRPSPAW